MYIPHSYTTQPPPLPTPCTSEPFLVINEHTLAYHYHQSPQFTVRLTFGTAHSTVCHSLSCVHLFATPWSVRGILQDTGEFHSKNTGVDCHSLLQETFLTQGMNLGLLHCRQILYHLSYQGSPVHSMGFDKCMLCYAKSLQSCPTLCDPIDGSPPGSPVPGIPQARTLEWVTISFSNA